LFLSGVWFLLGLGWFCLVLAEEGYCCENYC
jgi:hypothetical protein